jgi:hypothetical protein
MAALVSMLAEVLASLTAAALVSMLAEVLASLTAAALVPMLAEVLASMPAAVLASLTAEVSMQMAVQPRRRSRRTCGFLLEWLGLSQIGLRDAIAI